MFKDKEKIRTIFKNLETWQLIKITNEIDRELDFDGSITKKIASEIYSIDESDVTKMHGTFLSPFLAKELTNRMQK